MKSKWIMIIGALVLATLMVGSSCFFEDVPNSSTSTGSTTSTGTSTSSATSTSTSTSSATSTSTSTPQVPYMLDDFEDGDTTNANGYVMTAWDTNPGVAVTWESSTDWNHTASGSRCCKVWFKNPSAGAHCSLRSRWDVTGTIGSDAYNQASYWARTISGTANMKIEAKDSVSGWWTEQQLSVDTTWTQLVSTRNPATEVDFNGLYIEMVDAVEVSVYVDDIYLDWQ